MPNDPKDLSQDISSGSNWGPTNPDLLAAVKERGRDYREENGLAKDAKVPVDAVTAPARASTRTSRSRTRGSRPTGWRGCVGCPVAEVNELIDDNTDGRSLGFLGEPGVNVLELNVALDAVGVTVG